MIPLKHQPYLFWAGVVAAIGAIYLQHITS